MQFPRAARQVLLCAATTLGCSLTPGPGGELAFADGTWDSPEAQLLAVKAPAVGGGRATVAPRVRGTLITKQVAERFTLDCAQAGQSAIHAGDPAQDLDGDLVPDYRYDCIACANPDQHDLDRDACDADFDQNAVVNIHDLALMNAAFFRAPGPSSLDLRRGTRDCLQEVVEKGPHAPPLCAPTRDFLSCRGVNPSPISRP